jgi:uncharacterized protein (DUF2062 family)
VEGPGALREAAAIALGLFIGCLPFYGFHLLLCWGFGWLFSLNRLKVYLASNISNPFVAPWLVLAEIQTGAWLRHGAFQPLTVDAIRATGLRVLSVDLLVGSVAVGACLALIGGSATYLLLRASGDDAAFMALVRRTADRYVEQSIVAWEFARGKLRGDPIYRATIFGGLLPSGGTLIDIGCGHGLTLALLVDAHRERSDAWPSGWSAAPVFDRLIGLEIRPRLVALARNALGADAEILEGDARAHQIHSVRAVLLFDVLHMMARDEQDALLTQMAGALESGGVILIREADAAAGWRFQAVRIGNLLKAVACGAWRQRFHFRSRNEWIACFARHGLRVEVRPMGQGTPFGNLLFVLTAAPGASASTAPRGPLAQ